MQVKLNVSYYYIPHLDKPHYGIDPGYYKITVTYTKEHNFFMKSFYLPRHLTSKSIDLCEQLFIDPYTPFLPESLINFALCKEKEVMGCIMPIPEFAAELVMSTEFTMNFASVRNEYDTKVNYYCSDYDSELNNTVENYYQKDEIKDVSEYTSRVINHMFRFLSYKNFYNLVNDETFSFNKVYI